MAGPRCTVCDHDASVTINRLIAEGKQSLRSIANQFGVTASAILRHKENHVPAILKAAIKRREDSAVKTAVAVAERATATQTAVADEFLDDIQFSKRYAKLGVERCMTGEVDAETGEVKPTPIDLFRLAPGFLGSLDRANTLLGNATGRLNQAAGNGSVNLTIVLPRPTSASVLPEAIEVQAISDSDVRNQITDGDDESNSTE